MAANSGQTTVQSRIDPMIEVLMKGLIESASHPKGMSRAEDAITVAMIEALMPSTKRGEAQTPSIETTLLATILAPALAEALAPALVEALEPALVKALNTIISSRKAEYEPFFRENVEQGTPPKEGAEQGMPPRESSEQHEGD